MFGFFKRKEVEPVLIETAQGRWAIAKGEDIVGTYARKRDAIRGAHRKGIFLANV